MEISPCFYKNNHLLWRYTLVIDNTHSDQSEVRIHRCCRIITCNTKGRDLYLSKRRINLYICETNEQIYFLFTGESPCKRQVLVYFASCWLTNHDSRTWTPNDVEQHHCHGCNVYHRLATQASTESLAVGVMEYSSAPAFHATAYSKIC